MAKIVINADTDAGTIEVSVNGTVIDNVEYVSLVKMKPYDSKKDDYEVDCSISTMVKDENGVLTRTHICAREAPMGRTAAALGAPPYDKVDGFIVNPISSNKNEHTNPKAVVSAKEYFGKVFGKNRDGKKDTDI